MAETAVRPDSGRADADGHGTLDVVLLLVLLCLPTISYYVYYSGATIAALLLVRGNEPRFYGPARMLTAVIAIGLFGAMVRFYLHFSPNPNDLAELFKFVPALIIALHATAARRVGLDRLRTALLIYVVLDVAVSIAQVAQFEPFTTGGAFTVLFNSEGHTRVALTGSSIRALGLSPGPGQHGVMMTAAFAFFLADYLGGRVSARSLGGMAGALFAIIAAQSRTSIIAVGVCLVLVLLHAIIAGGSGRRRRAGVILLVLPAFVSLMLALLPDLRLLMRLFALGVTLSSYEAREAKWDFMLSSIPEQPLLALLGFGRDALGAAGRVFDNDYVYLLIVHGIIIMALFGLVLTRYLIWGMMRWGRLDECHHALIYMLLFGLPASWALTYFGDPRIMIVVALVASMCAIASPITKKAAT